MRKVLWLCIVIGCLFTSCDFTVPVSGTVQASQAQKESTDAAFSKVPAYIPQNYIERKMVNEFTAFYDKPDMTSYVYVISPNGTYLGYYVCKGKPVSTQSYNTPEDYIDGDVTHSGYLLRQAAAQDGTWGSDPTGIRFKTSDGIWVTVGGNLSYMYSSQPLNINVPKLVAISLK